MNAPNTAIELIQLMVPLVASLAVGPWMTLAALRVLRSPSHIERRSFMNGLIKIGARTALANGSVRRSAWMMLVGGILFDIVAIRTLVALLEMALTRWAV